VLSIDDSRASKAFTISYHEQLFSTIRFLGLTFTKTMRVCLRCRGFTGIDLSGIFQKHFWSPSTRMKVIYGAIKVSFLQCPFPIHPLLQVKLRIGG